MSLEFTSASLAPNPVIVNQRFIIAVEVRGDRLLDIASVILQDVSGTYLVPASSSS